MEVGDQVKGNKYNTYGITNRKRKEPMTVVHISKFGIEVEVNDGEHTGSRFDVNSTHFDLVSWESEETILNRMLLTQLIKEGVL